MNSNTPFFPLCDQKSVSELEFQLEFMVVDESDKFAYVMDYVEDKIFPLSLGVNGMISPFASGGVESGAGPRKAVIKSLLR